MNRFNDQTTSGRVQAATLMILVTVIGLSSASVASDRYIWCSARSRSTSAVQKFFSSSVFTGSASVLQLDSAFGKYIHANYPTDGVTTAVCTTYPTQEAATHFRDLEEGVKGKREGVTLVSTGWKYDAVQHLYCRQTDGETGVNGPCATGLEGCGMDSGDFWLNMFPDGKATMQSMSDKLHDDPGDPIPVKRQPDGTLKLFEAGYDAPNAPEVQWRRIITLKLSHSGGGAGYWEYGTGWIKHEEARYGLKGNLDAKYPVSCHDLGDQTRYIFCQGDTWERCTPGPQCPGGNKSVRMYTGVFKGRADAIEQYKQQFEGWLQTNNAGNATCWGNLFTQEDAEQFRKNQFGDGTYSRDITWSPAQ